jgi:hypothetical protein
MSERQRANNQHGAVSFLATQWRALIGADRSATSSTWSMTRLAHR